MNEEQARFAHNRAAAQAAIESGRVHPDQPWAEVAHLYRRGDPDTSRQAAEHVTTIGARADHLGRIVAAVKQRPGLTSAELGERTHLERHEAARRTADAANAGLITRGPQKACSIGGRAAVTWWPAPTPQVRDCPMPESTWRPTA